MNQSSPTVLEIRGLAKSFAAPVLVDLDFDLRAGEVHALVGSNGAGKSTLARILGGLLQPDRGQMTFLGAPYSPTSKKEAESLGIHMVMQELNLINSLSVAENIFLNRLSGRFGWIDYPRLIQETRNILPSVGLEDVDPRMPVKDLGVGQQQLVEIAAALSRPCRLLILDEPTAALTDPQINLLFKNIKRLQQKGVSLMYISHRMEEIQRIADRVTVLRDGRKIVTHAASGISIPQMVQQMAGQEMIDLSQSGPPVQSPVVLRVTNLCCGPLVREINFEVRQGEILGLAGLIGAGRTETLRAVFGADLKESGQVFGGPDLSLLHIKEPADAIRAGLGMIPEDRKQQGLLLPQSICVNTTLACMKSTSTPWGWINRDKEWQSTDRLCRQLDVQYRSLAQPMVELSGGNQQKIVMARWLWRDCAVLLCDEPTRGIDVAARQTIHQLLENLARAGKAIVLVSSELEELMALCHRIAVLSTGRLVKTFHRGEWTKESLTESAFSGHQGPTPT
jgi:ribose transport system ATP-binding protein